tara:strand:+ start:7226 stop:8863 length:1638 start_codon:yes stop_codon:yes gene_type:complete
MKIQTVLEELVSASLKDLGLETEVVLEHPADLEHGDFSCNAAMILAKEERESPKELAEKIAAHIPQNEYVASVSVAGPGFINFTLAKDFFTTQIQSVNEHWGKNDRYQGKRIMVEYTDPNPFKELHIGHLVPNAVGESLTRLYEYQGATVKRVTFQGDVGMHVAKAIWGLQKNNPETISANALGEAYATGAAAFDRGKKEEIKALNNAIYKRSDEAINKLYDAGKEASMKYFEEVYKILGSDFDHYFFESVTGPLGQAKVEENIGTIFQESEGAVVFRGEEYGLHTRVFINQEGLPTYEAKDIGLILAKQAWWPFDTAITVTGTEQESYYSVVIKAAELMMPGVANSIRLVPNGMLTLTEGKMSSRTGDVIPAMSFIESLVKKVQTRTREELDNTTLEAISVGAIKYAILRNTVGKDILFNPHTSLALEGDTGPYLQYTYARAQSVVRKARDVSIKERGALDITEVERLVYRFEEVVEKAARECQPHHVAQYLNDLASAFNKWYTTEHVLDGSDSEGYKVAITRAVATTLRNGLWVLGIQAPEKM